MHEPDTTHTAQDAAAALSKVSSTLRIPLAARALGDVMFPRLAVGDAHAAAALAGLGDDGRAWVRDRMVVWGILKRTRLLREAVAGFLAREPDARVVNLGCGLAQYFQWLDNGTASMTDADLPEVLEVRRRLVPRLGPRHTVMPVDLTSSGWWDALALPRERGGRPVCLMTEGVLMYLSPAQVRAVLAAFGERAPAGSVFVFDAMCWLAKGQAHWLAPLRRTGAQFAWGPRSPAEILHAHRRLRLDALQSIFADYGAPYSLVEPMFRAWWGVPFYGVYVLAAAPG